MSEPTDCLDCNNHNNNNHRHQHHYMMIHDTKNDQPCSPNVVMDKLVSAIAQFPATVGWNQVQQTLQPILNNNTTTVTRTTPHRITPLMVACDKAQVEAVRYLIQRLEQRPDLMGHHVTVEQAPTSGNTAIHFACMNDVPEILEILWSSSVNKYENNGSCDGWAALRNAHGDTPIMMCSTYNCVQTLTWWLQRMTQQQQQHCCSLLRLRNNANDSAMSLAAAHGHADMVKLLLSHTETAVVADDLHKAQVALHKTKRLQQQIVQRRPESVAAATLAQVETKARQIQQCIQLLTAVLQERADALAAELTSGLRIDEPTNNKSNTIRKNNGSKNRKSKSKNNNKTNRGQPSSTHHNNNDKEEYRSNPDGTDSTAQDCLQLTQLANGNRAIVVINSKSNSNDNDKEHDQSTETAIASGTTPSIQKLVPANALFPKNTTSDKDTLAALCLDPSHLLLTAHGMALHLSAAQLDCIQGILEGQLQAVATARQIQNRMHQTATNHHGLQQQKQCEEG